MASYGSIQKTGIHSWKLTVSGGFDGSGKRIRHTKTVRVTSDNTETQEKEARKLLALFIADIERGQKANSGKMTLEQFFKYWQENYSIGRHAPKTISFNKGLFNRIKEVMGHKRLDKIEPKHLLSFYKNLAEPGMKQDPNAKRRKTKSSTEKAALDPETLLANSKLSPNTIKKYHVFLHSLFEKAVQWNLIAYNPAERVEPPKTEKTIKRIYDEETIGKFLLLLEQDEIKHRLMALLLISTGMRRGEMFGLQWHHVDFDKATIKIEQASQYLPERGIFIKDTKNESSKRIITISASIINLLRQYKAEQAAQRLKLGGTPDKGGKWAGAEKPEDDYIFTTWNGSLAHPDSINTWLKKFTIANDLPTITPHSFRHMAATYLITSGTDIRTIAGKLGHASTTTTTVVYAHLLKSAEKETTNKMELFIQETTQKAKDQQKKQAK